MAEISSGWVTRQGSKEEVTLKLDLEGCEEIEHTEMK